MCDNLTYVHADTIFTWKYEKHKLNTQEFCWLLSEYLKQLKANPENQIQWICNVTGRLSNKAKMHNDTQQYTELIHMYIDDDRCMTMHLFNIAIISADCRKLSTSTDIVLW